jgi:hypothetical protein
MTDDDEPVLTETGEGERRSQPPHAEPNTQKSARTANRGGRFLPQSTRSDRSLTGAARSPPATAAMVYVDSWDEFVERSVQLFRADPIAVRREPDPLSSPPLAGAPRLLLRSLSTI